LFPRFQKHSISSNSPLDFFIDLTSRDFQEIMNQSTVANKVIQQKSIGLSATRGLLELHDRKMKDITVIQLSSLATSWSNLSRKSLQLLIFCCRWIFLAYLSAISW
jgi:hypothetical protein